MVWCEFLLWVCGLLLIGIVDASVSCFWTFGAGVKLIRAR